MEAHNLKAASKAALCALAVTCSAGSVHAHCFAQAASRFSVSAELLQAIAYVESHFRPEAVSTNRDGSINYGMMQIHESNLSWLGHTKETIMEPCANVMAGARVMADMIKRYGMTWRAVGSYNAGTSPARDGSRQEYVAKVRAAYESGAAPGKNLRLLANSKQKSSATTVAAASSQMAVFE